jgi:hypothetical protein
VLILDQQIEALALKIIANSGSRMKLSNRSVHLSYATRSSGINVGHEDCSNLVQAKISWIKPIGAGKRFSWMKPD